MPLYNPEPACLRLARQMCIRDRVYSYCTSWRERTNWPSYGGISEAPSACSICYMTTDTPLAPDSWTYKGEYFANPGTFGYPYGNNHSHLQKFSNAYYLLYHTQGLEQQMAINGGCLLYTSCLSYPEASLPQQTVLWQNRFLPRFP